MSGSLDQPAGTNVARKIKILDVTAYTIEQVETQYNENYGKKGWRVKQFFIAGVKRYLMFEKEI